MSMTMSDDDDDDEADDVDDAATGTAHWLPLPLHCHWHWHYYWNSDFCQTTIILNMARLLYNKLYRISHYCLPAFYGYSH